MTLKNNTYGPEEYQRYSQALHENDRDESFISFASADFTEFKLTLAQANRLTWNYAAKS